MKRSILLFCVICLFSAGCSSKPDGDPADVVRNYYKAINDKDSKVFQAALSKGAHVQSWWEPGAHRALPEGDASKLMQSTAGLRYDVTILKTVIDTDYDKLARVYVSEKATRLSDNVSTTYDSMFYLVLVEDGAWKLTTGYPVHMGKK